MDKCFNSGTFKYNELFYSLILDDEFGEGAAVFLLLLLISTLPFSTFLVNSSNVFIKSYLKVPEYYK